MSNQEKYKILSDHIEWIKEQNEKVFGAKVSDETLQVLYWAKQKIFHNAQYYKSIRQECTDYQDLLKKAIAYIDDRMVRLEITETIQHYIKIKREWMARKFKNNGGNDEGSI